MAKKGLIRHEVKLVVSFVVVDDPTDYAKYDIGKARREIIRMAKSDIRDGLMFNSYIKIKIDEATF